MRAYFFMNLAQGEGTGGVLPEGDLLAGQL
jgi:hypothetical protein